MQIQVALDQRFLIGDELGDVVAPQDGHLPSMTGLPRGLPELLAIELKVPIHVVPDPLTTVVRGTGLVLEEPDKYRAILVDDDEGSFASL